MDTVNTPSKPACRKISVKLLCTSMQRDKLYVVPYHHKRLFKPSKKRLNSYLDNYALAIVKLAALAFDSSVRRWLADNTREHIVHMFTGQPVHKRRRPNRLTLRPLFIPPSRLRGFPIFSVLLFCWVFFFNFRSSASHPFFRVNFPAFLFRRYF